MSLIMTAVQKVSIETADTGHLATTLWFSGCKIKCEDCFNPSLQEFKQGLLLMDLYDKIRERRHLTRWLVLVGGEPLDNFLDLRQAVSIGQNFGYKVVVFSGYDLKNISSDKIQYLKENVHYLKLGKYDKNKIIKDFRLASSNQILYKVLPTSEFGERVYTLEPVYCCEDGLIKGSYSYE